MVLLILELRIIHLELIKCCVLLNEIAYLGIKKDLSGTREMLRSANWIFTLSKLCFGSVVGRDGVFIL